MRRCPCIKTMGFRTLRRRHLLRFTIVYMTVICLCYVIGFTQMPIFFNSLIISLEPTITKKEVTLNGNFERIAKGINRTTNNVSQLEYCSQAGVKLKGYLPIPSESTKMSEIERQCPDVNNGGEWEPRDCAARDTVAIVIPYRNREKHLLQLLSVLHPLLQRQRIHYRFFVVEQFGNERFNKGMIMNIAFGVADTMLKFDCVIFHDVDLVPLDDRNPYGCSFSSDVISARHLSANITGCEDLDYFWLVGGVMNLRTEVFKMVNGYSNKYWGWGAEDDDMYYRMYNRGLRLEHAHFAYAMLGHTSRRDLSDELYLVRKRLLASQRNMDRARRDGLSTLHLLEHKIMFIKPRSMYTHIMVDLGKPPYQEP